MLTEVQVQVQIRVRMSNVKCMNMSLVDCDIEELMLKLLISCDDVCETCVYVASSIWYQLLTCSHAYRNIIRAVREVLSTDHSRH